MLVGNRIPQDFFVTTGAGESDLDIHAGSFHLALKDAGIENYNIMRYSSILPVGARKVSAPELLHGSVLECIISEAHSEGDGGKVSAGIGFGWLFDKMTNQSRGGIVCERNAIGEESEAAVKCHLQDSLKEIYENGFSNRFELRGTEYLVKSVMPQKRFGTALVALCFVSYKFPILGGEVNV